MVTFHVELMSGRKVVRSVSIAAQSPVHAVVKMIPKPMKPGKTPGKPYIQVRSPIGGKTRTFQLAD